jgi:cytochrome c-type biogenesis protein CcmH/NrfG
MDRTRLSFWTRFIAIFLASMFVISSIFIGFTATGAYNLLEVFSGPAQQEQQQGEDPAGGPDPAAQIEEAEREYEENPEDPEAIRQLAALYIQNDQPSQAVEALEESREAAPDDPEIPTLLGLSYAQQAEAASDEGERQELYQQAGDAFAEATENDPENEEAFLRAGSAYEEAGDTGRAIQYYNGYLELEPEGETADQVREQISTLLEGGGAEEEEIPEEEVPEDAGQGDE